jgi:hypothetical protein
MLTAPGSELSGGFDSLARSTRLGDSSSWFCREQGSNIRDLVEIAFGDAHDKLVCGLVGEREPAAVHTVEGNGTRQSQPLVAVDQGAVTRQRMHPYQFPDLMAAAIQRGNLASCAATNNITPAAPVTDPSTG